MDRYGLICRSFYENPDVTQRELASILNLSLGTVNKLLGDCLEEAFLMTDMDTGKYLLTEQGLKYLERFKVDGAVITAAGFGSRFVPLTFETPKGLLEVFGERMIERQIKQLHEAGITDITIIVGYLKEKFEYLIDKYQVKLLYNPEYATKNNLATIYHARELFRGRNMYLLVSDNWIRNNMYHKYECGAWYSSVYMDGETSEWCLSSNKKGRITSVQVGGHDSWVMYGPAFLSRDFSNQLIPLIEEAYHQPGTEQWYWEQVVVDHIKELDFSMNCQPADQVYEFENLEELRLFDPKYQNHSDNAAMQLVAHVFNVKEEAIHNIRCLKSGMTNQSFLFELDGKHYICRITEHILYFDGKTGYKIAQYYEGARNADAKNPEEMAACMEMLRKLHHSGVTVPHTFRIRERIDFYERICRGHEEMLFEDYPAVRARMNELMDRLDTLERPCCLSHIDSVADNFLFLPDGSLRLIDWEYAGMCDPLIDIAMCSIYSYYSQEELDHLLEEYLQHAPSDEERFVTYAYAALGGFLWALWAVFKSMEGREFGDYTIVMYRYAKNYYRKIVSEGLLKL